MSYNITAQKHGDNVHVTVKTDEPRGVHQAAIRHLVFNNLGHSGMMGKAKKGNVESIHTLSGRHMKSRFKEFFKFKSPGAIFKYKQGVSPDQAKEHARDMLNDAHTKATKEASKREKWKEGASDRKKEYSKTYSNERKAAVQKLHDLYGKKNVQAVTSRQIGGDDGYQHHVLIHGRTFVNGLHHSEVPHYKKQAYEYLLKTRGKQ